MHQHYEFPINVVEARLENLVDLFLVRLGFKENKFITEIQIPSLINIQCY